jgi:hypothetical protein
MTGRGAIRLALPRPMLRKLQLASEPHTVGHRAGAAFVGALENQAALEFGDPAEYREHELATIGVVVSATDRRAT